MTEVDHNSRRTVDLKEVKMNENQVSQNNLLDATDCLEAVGVFRGWKNFLFVIVLLCLLLLQACFWLVTIPGVRGYFVGSDTQATTGDPQVAPEALGGPNVPAANAVFEASPAAQSEPNEPNAVAEGETPPPAQSEPNEPAAVAEGETPPAAERTTKGRLFGMTFRHLAWLIHFVNAVLILAATLYCLTMLFSLKVSLVGRLGGINHVCRAFFLSLLMLVLLLPWQIVFGRIVAGAIYTPQELQQWCSAETVSRFGLVLSYLRFSGYWLLVLLLLLLSQFRSSRWARAILRRLEII
jgi:hypothetical protein